MHVGVRRNQDRDGAARQVHAHDRVGSATVLDRHRPGAIRSNGRLPEPSSFGKAGLTTIEAEHVQITVDPVGILELVL